MTAVYEAALRRRDDGRMAVVSVKSGDSAYILVAALRAAAADAQAFAFSTHDRYDGGPAAAGVTVTGLNELESFVRRRPHLLPPRVAYWLSPSFLAAA